MQHPIGHVAFGDLVRGCDATSHRASSWDRTGANNDFIRVGPGETVTLLDHEGPGCVTHVYFAMGAPEMTDYRDAILRCFWDGEATPSVEVPLGDFFGICQGRIREYRSAITSVNPGMGASWGMNAYFPMPFREHALVTIEQRGDTQLGGPIGALWYHIDFEAYTVPFDDGVLSFHSQFRQEVPTVAAMEPVNQQLHDGVNLDGNENYVAVETVGRGHLVGLVLEIDNLAGGWYGEGDDMVFIDGDTWPPRIHGTGTEEVFGGGACPAREYAGPYHGFHLIERDDYGGLTGMYRWFVADPVRFKQSLRWTIEHGHANNFSNGYSSVASWYQSEPHGAFPELPSRDEMRPRFPPEYTDARIAAFTWMARHFGDYPNLATVAEPFYAGRFAEVLRIAGTAGQT